MRLTAEHVRFWQAKKAPRPGWAARFPQPTGAGIHWLINCQVPRTSYSTEPGNTLHLIRRYRSTEDLIPVLIQYARTGSTAERRAWCLRWLRQWRTRHPKEA